MTSFNIFVIAISFCIAVAITNVITNVIKKVIRPAQLVCLVTSAIVSELGTYLYCTYFNIPLYWYIFVIALIIGFVICYTAMYGYDNLYHIIKDVIKHSKELRSTIEKMDVDNDE